MVGVNCPNQSAIHLANNLAFYSQMKHIDIRYHFVTDVVDKHLIFLLKVHIDTNPANILMKLVTQEKFNWSMIFLVLELLEESDSLSRPPIWCFMEFGTCLQGRELLDYVKPYSESILW